MIEQKTLTTILKTNLSCQNRMFVGSLSLLQIVFLLYLSFCNKRIKENMENTEGVAGWQTKYILEDI